MLLCSVPLRAAPTFPPAVVFDLMIVDNFLAVPFWDGSGLNVGLLVELLCVTTVWFPLFIVLRLLLPLLVLRMLLFLTGFWPIAKKSSTIDFLGDNPCGFVSLLDTLGFGLWIFVEFPEALDFFLDIAVGVVWTDSRCMASFGPDTAKEPYTISLDV